MYKMIDKEPKIYMVPTEFGSNVRKGYTLYETGLFEESIKPWEDVIAEAGNYEAAYVGIGKALQLKNPTPVCSLSASLFPILWKQTDSYC